MKPHGRRIELALTRARAVDPATKIGSVFLHPGGPGGSGVDFIQNAPPQAIAAITRRYAQPFTRPETLDVFQLVDHTSRYLRRCMELNGDLMEHMSSADVARDLAWVAWSSTRRWTPRRGSTSRSRRSGSRPPGSRTG